MKKISEILLALMPTIILFAIFMLAFILNSVAQNSATDYQKEVAVSKAAASKFTERKDTVASPFDYDEVVEDGKVKVILKTGSKTKKMTLDKVSTEAQQNGSTRVYLVYTENKFGERKISKVIYK